MRGVLVVNKPSGISSYDVIRRLKHMLPEKPQTPNPKSQVADRDSSIDNRHSSLPLGHAGTLDPLASGVLLILVGEATKVSRFLLTESKEYEAGILFGIRTDTDDVTGKTIAEAPVPDVSAEEMRSALARFEGTITQVPPSYSALKQDGRPMYELAREGIEVNLRPRQVTVHELELLDWTPPRCRIRAHVSAGTYIRALARDIGTALGSCATLEHLVRTRCGHLGLKDAVNLDQLEASELEARLLPVGSVLPNMPARTVSPEQALRLKHGQRLPADPALNGFGLAHTADGRFLAIVTGTGGTMHTERVIHAD